MSLSRAEGFSGITRSTEAPAQGGWLFALWRDQRAHVVAPSHYMGTVDADCREFSGQEVLSGLVLGERMAGAGVFDLDGRLVGIVLRCGERWVTLSVSTVEALLADGASFRNRLLERTGMRLSALDAAESSYFGVAHGVLVTETWRGYPADLAGLRPGDVIVAVDERPAEVPGDLAALADDGGGLGLLRIKRGGRTRSLDLPPAPSEPGETPEQDPQLGLRWPSPPPGQLVEAVLEGSLADQAGVRPGDRLVRVNQAEVGGVRQARRALSRRNGKPIYLELGRGHKRWGVLLPPQ
jgi:S1-C subfamily serine protease